MDPVWTKNMYALYNYTYKEHYDIFIGLYGYSSVEFPKKKYLISTQLIDPHPWNVRKVFPSFLWISDMRGSYICTYITYVLPIIIIHEFGFFFYIHLFTYNCRTPHPFGFMELRQILEISPSEKQKRSYD